VLSILSLVALMLVDDARLTDGREQVVRRLDEDGGPRRAPVASAWRQ
jgi:hypothetical protein